MSASSELYCEPCDKECGNDSNLKGHLAGKSHREKVHAIIARDRERLNASASELTIAETRLKNTKSLSDGYEETIESQKREIDANESTVEEQRQQIQKNASVLSAQKSELDPLTEKTNALRSECDALTRRAEALKAEKSKTEAEIAELTEQIRKNVELRPELEKAARNEIMDQLVREEIAKFDARRLALTNLSLLYQRGEISKDEYFRQLRELNQK